MIVQQYMNWNFELGIGKIFTISNFCQKVTVIISGFYCTWTFWTVTWPFLGVEQPIIPHLKEGYLVTIFLIFPNNFYFLSIFWSRAGLMQVSSKFWTATYPFLITDRAILPHLKEKRQGFHMNPNQPKLLEILWSKWLCTILSQYLLVM